MCVRVTLSFIGQCSFWSKALAHLFKRMDHLAAQAVEVWHASEASVEASHEAQVSKKAFSCLKVVGKSGAPVIVLVDNGVVQLKGYPLSEATNLAYEAAKWLDVYELKYTDLQHVEVEPMEHMAAILDEGSLALLAPLIQEHFIGQVRFHGEAVQGLVDAWETTLAFAFVAGAAERRQRISMVAAAVAAMDVRLLRSHASGVAFNFSGTLTRLREFVEFDSSKFDFGEVPVRT